MHVLKDRTKFFLLILAALIAGCASEPTKPAEAPKPAEAAAAKEEKPPEAVTGRVAFQKLFATARMWAIDAKPYRLESQPTKAVPGADGKAAVWRGAFASASRRAVKPYVWSGVQADDAPERGISPGTEDTYNPANVSTQPFDFAFLKMDSDKAFEVAQSKGGTKITGKDPNQPLKYELDWNPRANKLNWHVTYGTSTGDAKLRVILDASTGEFVRIAK